MATKTQRHHEIGQQSEHLVGCNNM